MSNSYWDPRQEKFWAEVDKADKNAAKNIYKINESMGRKVKRDIDSFLSKYSAENVAEFETLTKTIDPADIKQLYEDWEGFVEKYPQYKHLTDVRKSIYKMNRLEGLQNSILLRHMEAGALTADELAKHADKIAKLASNKVADLFGNGYGKSEAIEKLYHSAKWFDGSDLSEAVWESRKNVAEYVNKKMRDALIRGDDLRTISKDVRELAVDQSNTAAQRLVHTESTAIYNLSSMKQFESYGYTHYKYSAVMDERTSKVCSGLDGKIFAFKDAKVGTNFPPMHPNCRSSFEVVLDDEKNKKSSEISLVHENKAVNALLECKSAIEQNDDFPKLNSRYFISTVSDKVSAHGFGKRAYIRDRDIRRCISRHGREIRVDEYKRVMDCIKNPDYIRANKEADKTAILGVSISDKHALEIAGIMDGDQFYIIHLQKIRKPNLSRLKSEGKLLYKKLTG